MSSSNQWMRSVLNQKSCMNCFIALYNTQGNVNELCACDTPTCKHLEKRFKIISYFTKAQNETEYKRGEKNSYDVSFSVLNSRYVLNQDPMFSQLSNSDCGLSMGCASSGKTITLTLSPRDRNACTY